MRLNTVLLAAAMLVALPFPAFAQNEAQPRVIKQDGAFGVMALITADPNWMNEWNRTDGQPPRLNTASEVGLGDTAQVLVAFAGATPVDGRLQIACDVTMTVPDGSTQRLDPVLCFDHELVGPAESARLLDIDMGLVVEKADPPGLYSYAINATDKGSGRSVSLTVSVNVVTGEGA